MISVVVVSALDADTSGSIASSPSVADDQEERPRAEPANQDPQVEHLRIQPANQNAQDEHPQIETENPILLLEQATSDSGPFAP